MRAFSYVGSCQKIKHPLQPLQQQTSILMRGVLRQRAAVLISCEFCKASCLAEYFLSESAPNTCNSVSRSSFKQSHCFCVNDCSLRRTFIGIMRCVSSVMFSWSNKVNSTRKTAVWPGCTTAVILLVVACLNSYKRNKMVSRLVGGTNSKTPSTSYLFFPRTI